MGVTKTQVVKFIRKGDPGTDAVLWTLTPSVSQLTIDKNGIYSTGDIDCYVYKIVGGVTTAYLDANSSPLPSGYKVMWVSDTQADETEYILNDALSSGSSMKKWVTFILRQPDGTELARTTVIAVAEGEDAINIVIDSSEVVFNDTVKTVQVKVNLYDGNTKVPNTGTDCFTCSIFDGNYLFDNAVKCAYRGISPDNYTMSYFFTLEGTAANGTADITITYKNKEYVRTLSFRTVKNGVDGEDGNGIVSQTSYFVLSNKDKGVTHDNTTGWSTTFPAPTEQLPYVWKCVFTNYSQITDTWSTAEMVAVYQSGANPNLLDNAAFTNDDNMGAWSVKSQYSVVSGASVVADKGYVDTVNKYSGRNSFRDSVKYNSDSISYKEILCQTVHDYTTNVKKLTAGKWYTLSFWAKGYQQISVNKYSTGYGVGEYAVYLTVGKEYTIQVSGRIYTAQSTYYLKTYIYDRNWSESASCSTTATGTNTLHSMTFTPKTTGTYYIQSYHYSDTYNGNNATHTGSVYVEWYRIVDAQDLTTYVYPSAIDANVEAFVDGVEQSIWVDGEVHWTLGADWSFHKISFKTKADLSTAVANVLFRIYPTLSASAVRYINICMPKLEAGMMATGFIDNASDTKGDRGPALRGPQAWSDCATGYVFQAGGTGEAWQDVVMYGDNCYSCKKSHAKTADNYPGSTTANNNGLWQLGDKIELIATKILLAQYALVKNLGVETIDMKDANGNILFQAKDGNVICKTGTFENITVTGQSVFTGLSKKAKTIITADNYTTYCTLNTNDYYFFNWEKCGTWVELSGSLPVTHISLPSSAQVSDIDQIRCYVGAKVILYNESTGGINLHGVFLNGQQQTTIAVAANQGVVLECKLTPWTEDKELVYWEMTRFTI